ncbi:MAG: phosphotransferase [Deltaproteobacteria bacterium]|nr:phosphotransferase [Deltaproteobacteria bacterium]
MTAANAWAQALTTLDAQVAHREPAWRASEPAFRTAKCVLQRGLLGSVQAIVKSLGPREGPWRWYFARERALYRALRTAPFALRTPSLLVDHADTDWIILEAIDGQAVSSTRACRAPWPTEVRENLLRDLGVLSAISPTDLRWPALAPSDSERAALRARLLEDPSAPTAWITEGLARAGHIGLLDEASAALALEALAQDPTVASAHGDLLLRNVLATATHELIWIDWECAGSHHRHWDLALLWINATAPDRGAIESQVSADVVAQRSFAACALFACARERLYRQRSGARDTRGQWLRDAEALLTARLRPLC